MGAWIETLMLPAHLQICVVALYMGAWIETSLTDGRPYALRRTLYGCVD